MERSFVPRTSTALALLLLTLVACAPPERLPGALAPPKGASMVRGAPEPAPPQAAAPQARPAERAAIVVPADAIYVCVHEVNGTRQQTVIEFSPKVYDLCKRHPEMGPCQYERNACRKGGGRVFAANGKEITMQTEAEYDRKVRRVTLRSN
jgi:hypothetical protein